MSRFSLNMIHQTESVKHSKRCLIVKDLCFVWKLGSEQPDIDADKPLHSLHHYRLLFCRPPWHLTGIQSLPQQRYPKQRSSSRHMPLDKAKVGVTGMKSDALAACEFCWCNFVPVFISLLLASCAMYWSVPSTSCHPQNTAQFASQMGVLIVQHVCDKLEDIGSQVSSSVDSWFILACLV